MKARNPFNKNRTEQMGEATWKYYVKEPFNDLLSEKPLIFEGSRGCGKTMFFLCNSWKEKFAEYDSKKMAILDLFSENQIIGFYYKVDGKFAGDNLSGKGVEDYVWQSIFNTYFNTIVAKEIFCFIKDCIVRNFIMDSELIDVIVKVNRKLEHNTDDNNINTCLNYFDIVLDEIEAFSNDPEKKRPIGLHAGTLIKEILEGLRKIEVFKKTRFHVFIDEFEELNAYQQKQLNTLVKQHAFWLVYDIGVKTSGRYTSETISGQLLQEPDDYGHYYPEIKSYERKKEYEQLLVWICEKRLEEYIPAEYSAIKKYKDINFYLKDYSETIELNEFAQSPLYPKIKDRLTKMIEADASFISSDKETKDNIRDVLINQSPDIVRMHICLLLRKDKVSAIDLYTDAKNKTSAYKEYKGNTLFGTYFLLAKELEILKSYHGVRTFSMLSSGVIRSFLEICESAFNYAFSKDFNFEHPRPLTIEEQTNAAYYVSQTKLSKIEGLVPDGMHLKRFIMSLGKIFYMRHTNPNTTLGEPEPNHFHTKPLELKSLSPDASIVLDHAIMHNILQNDLPTKEKKTLETTDYHINHIYCPYLKISHRRKRKIYLEPSDLKILLIGTSREIEKVIKSVSNEDVPTNNDSQQGTLELL